MSSPFPNKQLFGWTDPETPMDSYVGYIAVHSHPCDTIMVAVRGHRSADGAPVSIAIPMNEALALAQSINAFANEVNYPPDDDFLSGFPIVVTCECGARTGFTEAGEHYFECRDCGRLNQGEHVPIEDQRGENE